MDKYTLIKSAIKANVPLLLEGHTGTGKTYTILELAKAQNKIVRVINVSGELTVDSILGQNTLVDGNVVWRDGVLTHAMRNGEWVLFDELNTALPEVLTIINGVLDDTRSVTLPNADNERVEAHEEFRFIGTQNPSTGDYAGTGKLNDALLNRMVRVEFGYMRQREELAALKKHTKLADNTLIALIDIANYSRNTFDNPISTRDLVKILRLRDDGKLSVGDAIYVVLRDKYSNGDYSELYNRYSRVMTDLERYSTNKEKDIFDDMREQFEKVQKAKNELERQKRDLRTEVKRELLKELLGGDTGTKESVPEDF